MNNRMLAGTTVAIAMFALMGCDQRETPAETRSDMAEAAQEGSEDIADAQRDVNEARTENREEIADAQADVDLAKAEADYKVAIEGCEASTGDARDRCKEQAKATLDAAQARADANRDAMKP
jgi:hypothetical protein